MFKIQIKAIAKCKNKKACEHNLNTGDKCLCKCCYIKLDISLAATKHLRERHIAHCMLSMYLRIRIVSFKVEYTFEGMNLLFT